MNQNVTILWSRLYPLALCLGLGSAGCTHMTEVDLINPTPLSVVVQLRSAEESLKFEEAKQWIDLDRVYAALDAESSSDIEEAWMQICRGFHALGQNRKFENRMHYHRWTIEQAIDGTSATVRFIRKSSKGDDAHTIFYELERRGEGWVVVGFRVERK